MGNKGSIRKELEKYADSEKAKLLQGFFKTGKGEYGEGDVFLGITVPKTREVAKKFREAEYSEIEKSLESEIHEERLCALLILVEKFSKSGEEEKEKIYDFYINHARKVNNWDLVDLSAHKIVGKYLVDKNREMLYKLAESENLWEKRISIISTFAFIAENDFKDSLALAEKLLQDKHDLIHKAVGWVLREIGKKNMEAEEKFLKKHYKKMPRTALRYAIERFPEKRRKEYLLGKV